jgi:adenylate cyclase
VTSSRRPLLTALLLSLLSGLAVTALTLLGAAQPTVERSWDVLWPAGSADHSVVVVAIDEASLAEYGAWPWDDERQAELLSAIADADPLAIGYDVLLAPRTDPGVVAAALEQAPTVVARGFAAIETGERLPRASGAIPLDAALAAAASGVGHAAVTADRDGLVRTVPLVVESPEGDLVPSLALAVAATGTVAPGEQPLVRRTGVAYGGIEASTEPGALLRISWARGLTAGTGAVVSAADVLAGRVAPGVLDGASVLVGVTAPAIGDRHVSPLQPGATTPGVFVQAQALSTLLSRTWVTPVPAWANGAAAALLTFLPVLLALASRLRWTFLALAIALVVSLAGVVVLFGSAGMLGDVVRVPLAILLATGAGIGLRSIDEAARRREAVDLFSRYVPGTVARELLRSGRAAEAREGVRLRVAVLFCDLRGFTPLSASLDPPRVREVLDAFYAEVCDVVFGREGTVMQFVGDEVFAVFGAPEPLDDPVTPAWRTATTLLDRADSFRATLATRGLPEVHFGIGLHVGDVVATHVGPRDRRQYAVVGDAVNVGSRLCGLAAADELVASGEAVDAVDDVDAIDGDSMAETVRVKGKDGAIAVVRVSRSAQR